MKKFKSSFTETKKGVTDWLTEESNTKIPQTCTMWDTCVNICLYYSSFKTFRVGILWKEINILYIFFLLE